ncbi:hypothetical protein, partial [Endozoicomonas sp. ONNA1]|uniref:hypothetical protein n=1 Tax=Endozoicomonas sp. ONNA1 TaxID=2828740 RepID=UPI0021473976
EFTLEHIRAASSVITPTWLQIQLTRHFSFRPVLRGLLNNQNFVQGIMSLIPVVDESQLNASCNDDQFAFKVLSDMARQLIERESMLAEQLAREGKLIRVSNQLKLILEKATTSEKQKLIVLQLKQQAEHELEQLRGVSERQQSLLRKFGQKVERIPELEKQIRNARAEATKARNAGLAEELGIEDWDDSQPPENQARLISIKIHAINKALAATEQPEGDSIETTLAAVQHQNARTDAESKASYATIAAHLNLQNFDTSANIDAQLDHLLWRIEALNTQLQSKHILNLQQKSLFDKFQSLNTQGNTLDENQQHLLKKIQALNAQCCTEEPDVKTQQDGLALTLRIRLDEDSTMEEHPALKTAMYERFSSLEYLEEELKDIRTPGHPKAMPVVLEKLSNVEKALKMDNLNSQDDVYYRRNAISEAIQASLAKARQQEEEVALKILKTVEEILKIEVNNEDHKTARLDRIRTKLDSGDVSESMVDKIEHSLRKEDIIFTSKRGNTKLRDLQNSLEFYVEKVNRLAIIEQTKILKVLEDKLHIYEFVRDEADEKGKAFVAKLANDLGVILRRKAHLPENKYVLENKILALMEEVDETYGNEDVRRSRNNEIAHQLNIKNYEDDTTIDDQNILIKGKLRELYKEVPKVGDATVNEHIAAIEGELDRQIARLGPKPRYVLDRELARARRVLEEAGHELAGLYRRLNHFRGKHVLFAEKPDDLQHQSEAVSVAEDTLADPHKAILHAIEESLSRKPESSDTYEQRVNALRNKQLQLGGYDGSGGKIQQLIQERVRLGREIETREEDFERMKKDLKAAEKAVKNDGGPFQFSTRQVNVLADMNTFTRQHSLKQQALDAALGLMESAFSSGKTIPCLTTFDF